MSQVSALQPKLHTAKDIERFDAQGLRYELIYGELLPMSPTSITHGRDTIRLTLAIGNYVEENGLGEVFAAETGFRLSKRPDTVLAPDLSFVRGDRHVKISQRGFGEFAPDLVVEVRSPSDSNRSVAAKVQRWLDFGVPLVLDLDSKRKVLTVHRPGRDPETLGADDTLGGYDILPGFEMPMSRVFR